MTIVPSSFRTYYVQRTRMCDAGSPAVLLALPPHDRCTRLFVLVPTACLVAAVRAELDEAVLEQPPQSAEAGLADGALVGRERNGAQHRRHEARHAHECAQLAARVVRDEAAQQRDHQLHVLELRRLRRVRQQLCDSTTIVMCVTVQPPSVNLLILIPKS